MYIPIYIYIHVSKGDGHASSMLFPQPENVQRAEISFHFNKRFSVLKHIVSQHQIMVVKIYEKYKK